MVEHLLIALVVLLVAAKLGGALAERFGQPAVLGELLAGVAVGALPLLGMGQLVFLGTDPVVDALADLGVILLLFEVGLSTRLADLMKVGWSAFLVATVGVIVPMILGALVGAWLLPTAPGYVHVFLGATLSATSVGITARVLQDMGKVRTPEGQIVLGAAVIDDVMGLLVLAVMVGLAGGSGTSTGLTAVIVTVKALVFIGGSLVLGRLLAPRLFALTARLRGRGVVFTAALVTAFVLALAAHLAGLAPIVGAFAAGLVLEGVPFGELLPEGESLEKLLIPLSSLLVPIFFVRMGLRVDLPGLAGGSLLLAAGLTVAAIVGKQACGLGVVNRGVDRIAVGLGMIPRGEVGLIFAGMGLDMKFGGKPVLGPGEFAAVVAMVMVTTLVTPPLLRWRMTRGDPISADGHPRGAPTTSV